MRQPVCLNSVSIQVGLENLSVHPLRLLVADDHPVVCAGMVALLEREADMRVVVQACDGAKAVSAWQAHEPDVGLIDLSMPVLDGFGAIAAIRSMAPHALLVVMTTMCGDEDVFRALQAGASGFLLKDCGQQELIGCVRAVANGRKYLQSPASARLAERVASVDLTAREADVLCWLAQGLSNKAISRRLGVAEGTVKTHMKALLNKLGVDSRTQAVRLALLRGLVRLQEANDSQAASAARS
jgi:two-component system, NarL family, response regulator